jgi:hypothetical protein
MEKKRATGRTKRYRIASRQLEDQHGVKPRCGLCGKTANLTKTPCCGQWICDDEDQYVPFSYARNSCHRNHSRFTLCSHHHAEEHGGRWQECPKCREAFKTEMYVWYGTNEYNFEKLENPPEYEPTLCSRCGRVINLGEDGYTTKGEDYWCEKCAAIEMSKLMGQTRKRKSK